MTSTDTPLDRIREGADPTPRDPAAVPTPGQAWAELLAMDPGVRLERLAALIDASARAAACFQEDHGPRIEYAEQELATVRDTLRHRSNALNATGTHNDQLRATLARCNCANSQEPPA